VVTAEKEKKMYRTTNRVMSTRRTMGVLVVTGAAAGLLTLAVGTGAATAEPDAPYMPGLPSLADSVSLNPQPLPPGPDWSRVALNPQPLPPGPDWRLVLSRAGF
jgi:hypothetical protein